MSDRQRHCLPPTEIYPKYFDLGAHTMTDWARERPKCFQSVCSYLVFHIHNWAMFHSLISHCIATAARKQCYKCCVSTYSKKQIDYLFSQIAFRLNLFMVVFLSLWLGYFCLSLSSVFVLCVVSDKKELAKNRRAHRHSYSIWAWEVWLVRSFVQTTTITT